MYKPKMDIMWEPPQREFGITPVSVAGGTVKVKDELKIDFDVRTSTQAAAIMWK